MVKEAILLGHKISKKGIEVDPTKMDFMQNLASKVSWDVLDSTNASYNEIVVRKFNANIYPLKIYDKDKIS